MERSKPDLSTEMIFVSVSQFLAEEGKTCAPWRNNSSIFKIQDWTEIPKE